MAQDFFENQHQKVYPKHWLTNTIIINTKCINVMRAVYGRERMTDEEYHLCDVLGEELAMMFPDNFEINRLNVITPEQILEWAEQRAREEQTLDDLRLAEETKTLAFSKGDKWLMVGFLSAIATIILLMIVL